MPEIDILVAAPHPDDAELCCGGLLLKAKRAGLTCAVVDLTQGEMGTRGTIKTRMVEAAEASKLLGLAAREQAKLPDGHLEDNKALRTVLVRALRKYRPCLFLIPHWEDQHPDHAAVGQAGLYAAWLCGAPRYDAKSAKGVASAKEKPYRPPHVLHYNNRYGIQADLVIDISEVMEEKLALVGCYKTQFGPGPAKSGPRTRLSDAAFIEFLKGMHAFYGYQASVAYGEAYCTKSPLRIGDLSALCKRGR
jgi:bacillithiol biosynthesis deacetylase BshB1